MAIDHKDAKKLLSQLVVRLERVAVYADAMYSENSTSVYAKDKTGIQMHNDQDEGVKLRAFDGSKFHEAGVQGFNPTALKKATEQLVERVKKSERGIQLTLKIDRKTKTAHYTTIGKEDPRTVEPKRKTELLEKIHKEVIEKGFLECQMRYQEQTEQRLFVNRFKQLSSEWTGCVLTVMPMVQAKTGEIRSDFFRRFGNGFEVTEFSEEELDKVLKRTKKLEKSKRIKPGKYKVVLAPNVAGLLAHESFGHGMEADTILHGRARAEQYIGKRIASPKVNICENPGYEGAYGYLSFDDEGMIPNEIFMVERGVVRDPLTDLASASRGGFRRSANGRSEAFDRKVYARMTNTYFKSGKDSVEKLIKSVKEGYYLHYGTAGMEDPRGWGVQLSGILAEKIKNGKLTGELVAEVSMGGYLPEILNNITGVGSDFEIVHDAGHCAKNTKEWVRVSSGGPHLLIKEVPLS